MHVKNGPRSSRSRRGVRLALCAALVSGAVVAGAGAAAAECESVWVPAYDLTMEVDRAVYRLGDTVRVEATVTRADSGTPVEDAVFVTYAHTKRWIAGFTRTDAAGHAVAKLKLGRKSVEPGSVRLHGIAYDEIADATCATVTEYGEQEIPNAFRVKP